MAINLQALDMFRTATDWTANGIANLDGNDGIKQNGTYGGALGSLGRSKIEKAANNEVRTELLRALGQTFNLDGMSEKDGEVTFSKGFMDQLEKILGADFKRDDFKIDSDGKVSSGRPLTARRIKAIITKAEQTSTAATAKNVGGTAPTTELTKTGGVRKDDTYASYVSKIGQIKKEIASLDKGSYEHVLNFFKRVEMSLDFLYNEIDVDRKDPNAPDPSALRNDPEYEFLKELGDLKEGDKPSFQYYDSKQGKFVKLENTKDYSDFIWKRVGGGLLHLERADFSQSKSEDIKPLRKYIVDNLRLFVMKSIDTYFASKEAGKLDTFFEHLEKPGACLEYQCLHMVEFEAKNLSTGWQGLSTKEAEELERIARQDPEKLETPDVNQQIDDIFDEIGNEQWFLDKESWDKDIAAVLKERLLGKTCTITKYNYSTHKFEPLLEQGKPVVRPLTEADIDTFGALIFKETFM